MIDAGIAEGQRRQRHGAYDGMLIVEAPDEQTAAALFLSLAQHGNVKTQTLRAYERAEFEQLLEGL